MVTLYGRGPDETALRPFHGERVRVAHVVPGGLASCRNVSAMRNSSSTLRSGDPDHMPPDARAPAAREKHHHGGQTIAPYSGSIAGAPEATQLPALATERSPQPVHHEQRRSAGHEPERPKRCSGKVLGLIRLPSVPFLGAFSVGALPSPDSYQPVDESGRKMMGLGEATIVYPTRAPQSVRHPAVRCD